MSDYNNTHSNNTNDDLYDDDYITYEETNDDDYIDDDVLDPELDDFDIYRQNHSTNKKSSLNKQKPKLNPFVEEALSIIKLIAVAFIIAFILAYYKYTGMISCWLLSFLSIIFLSMPDHVLRVARSLSVLSSKSRPSSALRTNTSL